MKYALMACAVLAVLVAIPGSVSAAGEATEVALKGEPVDINCYLTGKAGEGHASCAKSCAERGNPIGLVTKGEDGKNQLILVTGSGGKAAKDVMAEHMGKQVTAKGKLSTVDGMKILAVSEVSAG